MKNHMLPNIRQYILVVAMLLVTAGRTLADPSWWTNVITTNAANDFAPVNMGQLKWMAVHAQDELNAYLPGGSGANLNTLLSGWLTNTVNYAPVNVGQLKNLAAHFYDRLIVEGYTNQYPWTDDPNASDYAIANIGQVKYLFDFELSVDSDADGLPDWWEMAQFGNLNQTADGDFNGDGHSNINEYLAGRDSDGDGICDALDFAPQTPDPAPGTGPDLQVLSPNPSPCIIW